MRMTMGKRMIKCFNKWTVHIEEAKILTVEPKWFGRGVKEAIYIRALHPSLNRDGGRYYLPPVYNNVITRHVNT